MVFIDVYVFEETFKLKLAFLWHRFPTQPKNAEQKFKYLKKEEGFQDEIKNIFHHF